VSFAKYNATKALDKLTPTTPVLDSLRSPKGMAHDQSYKDYINSPAWSAKRELAFKHHGRECKRCASTHFLHVHHKTYKNFKNENIENDLIPLCKPCHKKLHKYVQRNGLDLFHGSNDFIANVSNKAARRKKRRRNLAERLQKQWTRTNEQYLFKYIPRGHDIPKDEQARRLKAFRANKPREPKKTSSIDYVKMALMYGITVDEAKAIAP